MKNLITCLVVCVLSGFTFATTWTVDDDGKADFDNIQAAVDAASDGDEIIVMPGTYTGTGDEVVDMLGKAVTLRSLYPDNPDFVASTIMDCESNRRGIHCHSNESNATVIMGLTIINGSGSSPGCGGGGNGGGMLTCNSSNPTVVNCTFKNNSAYNGGGMCNFDNSRPVLIYCTFSGNSATYGGAMLNGSSSHPSLTDCTISNNSAIYYGGGIANWGDGGNSTLTNCTVCGNSPNQINGNYNDGGGNTVTNSCPVTWTVDDDGKADFDNIQAAVDAANGGDEILVYPGTYSNNGQWSIPVVSMRDGIWLHSAEGPEKTIIDGQLNRRCFSCYNNYADTVIEGFTITRGVANHQSGGSATKGGAFYISDESRVRIKNCTIKNNLATSSGGAIYSHNWYAPGGLYNCTIVGNSGGGHGGGMYLASGSSPIIDGCTISQNTTSYTGAGIYQHDSFPTLFNTIVCGNTGSGQIAGHPYEWYWVDGGGNTVSDECPACPDLNDDGIIDPNDIIAIIWAWGHCGGCLADINLDGIVDISDLVIVIDNWGPCE